MDKPLFDCLGIATSTWVDWLGICSFLDVLRFGAGLRRLSPLWALTLEALEPLPLSMLVGASVGARRRMRLDFIRERAVDAGMIVTLTPGPNRLTGPNAELKRFF